MCVCVCIYIYIFFFFFPFHCCHCCYPAWGSWLYHSGLFFLPNLCSTYHSHGMAHCPLPTVYGMFLTLSLTPGTPSFPPFLSYALVLDLPTFIFILVLLLIISMCIPIVTKYINRVNILIGYLYFFICELPMKFKHFFLFLCSYFSHWLTKCLDKLKILILVYTHCKYFLLACKWSIQRGKKQNER